ncbi:MAG: hypothetical protein ISS45_04870 [Candidatus Omnitrophica bacterium]|nr:hypothetical protein [Candidatus Omnitrophota bacterium]
MKSIAIVLVCLFLSTSICFAQQEYSVSKQTLNDIIQLKQYMDSYPQEALKLSKQLGAEQNEHIKKILNYLVIISSKLKAVISILDTEGSQGEGERSNNLTLEEAQKFITYVTGRMDTIMAELYKRSKSTNEALMIHHIEKVKGYIREGKRLLEQSQRELSKFK